MKADQQEQFVFNQQKNEEFSRTSQTKQLPPQVLRVLEGHLRQIQQLFNQTLIKETFQKSLPHTLIKKKVIKDKEEIKIQKAIQQGTEYTNSYIDKIQRWLNDGIFTTKRYQMLHNYKEKKIKLKQERIRNISKLIEKIAEKIKKKAFEQHKKNYEAKLQKQKVFYRQNEGVNSLIRQMRDLDSKLRFQQENIKKLSR